MDRYHVDVILVACGHRMLELLICLLLQKDSILSQASLSTSAGIPKKILIQFFNPMTEPGRDQSHGQ